MRRSSFAVAILIAVASTAMSAQERSLDDVKRDVTRRVAQRQPPFDDVRADEVARVLAR